MYYIYILKSVPSEVFYVGYTDNPERRLLEHNSSEENTYTSKHRPWIFAAIFQCSDDRAMAVKIEKFIKRQKSKTFIQKMINAEKLEGVLSQLIKVPHVRD